MEMILGTQDSLGHSTLGVLLLQLSSYFFDDAEPKRLALERLPR
jgi:hypothetical protein